MCDRKSSRAALCAKEPTTNGTTGSNSDLPPGRHQPRRRNSNKKHHVHITDTRREICATIKISRAALCANEARTTAQQTSQGKHTVPPAQSDAYRLAAPSRRISDKKHQVHLYRHTEMRDKKTSRAALGAKEPITTTWHDWDKQAHARATRTHTHKRIHRYCRPNADLHASSHHAGGSATRNAGRLRAASTYRTTHTHIRSAYEK